MRTTTSLLAGAIVIILTGCGEGTSGSDIGASSLTIANSTPAKNATNASLTEPISITVKEPLDKATVSTDTIQLIPAASAAGRGGMPGMGGTASMPGMATNLGRLAGIDVNSDEYLTPAGTVKGTVTLDPQTSTVIAFIPKTQLVPGTSTPSWCTASRPKPERTSAIASTRSRLPSPLPPVSQYG